MKYKYGERIFPLGESEEAHQIRLQAKREIRAERRMIEESKSVRLFIERTIAYLENKRMN